MVNLVEALASNMKEIERILTSEEDEYVYHATYNHLIPSIQEKGLTPFVENKNYDCDDYVYLGMNPYVADYYARYSETALKEKLDAITVFRIKVSDLDRSLLSIDEENGLQNNSFKYVGVIPWNLLEKIGNKNEFDCMV